METKKAIIFTVILLIVFSLTSCYDSTEVDDMVYVLAIGIDGYDDKNSLYTFQAAVPLNISSGVETGFAESEEEVTVHNISVTAPDLLTALERANSKLAKELNVAHCKIILFSEAVNASVLKTNIKNINNHSQFSPDTLIAMCQENVADFMDSISSPFEKNPARYYNMYFKKDFSLLSFNTKISEFEKNSALAIPLLTKNNVSKAVILNDYTNVITLSEEETFALNIIKGNFKKGFVTVNDDTSVDLHSAGSPEIAVNVKEPYPIFKIQLNLHGKTYSNTSNQTDAEKATKEYIKKICFDLLTKTATYNIDAADLIRHSRSKFLTLKSYENYNWKDKFTHSVFKININFNSIE